MPFKLPPLQSIGRVMTSYVKVLAWGGAMMLGLPGCHSMGKSAEGERRARMERSPQWHEGKFTNPRARTQASRFSLLKEMVFGQSAERSPAHKIPVQIRQRKDFDQAPELRTTWLGHSTLLVEIEGKRLLIDPVWGERASPVSFAGPLR
ncbi:MAG: hypothetical protein M3Q07_16155, partial [Pseudobdellovibrionaceae bacterium]|nr:hypothetical protein [Pseudobdellovibrionaceae bacterium]